MPAKGPRGPPKVKTKVSVPGQHHLGDDGEVMYTHMDGRIHHWDDARAETEKKRRKRDKALETRRFNKTGVREDILARNDKDRIAKHKKWEEYKDVPVAGVEGYEEYLKEYHKSLDKPASAPAPKSAPAPAPTPPPPKPPAPKSDKPPPMSKAYEDYVKSFKKTTVPKKSNPFGSFGGAPPMKTKAPKPPAGAPKVAKRTKEPDDKRLEKWRSIPESERMNFIEAEDKAEREANATGAPFDADARMKAFTYGWKPKKAGAPPKAAREVIDLTQVKVKKPLTAERCNKTATVVKKVDSRLIKVWDKIDTLQHRADDLYDYRAKKQKKLNKCIKKHGDAQPFKEAVAPVAHVTHYPAAKPATAVEKMASSAAFLKSRKASAPPVATPAVKVAAAVKAYKRNRSASPPAKKDKPKKPKKAKASSGLEDFGDAEVWRPEPKKRKKTGTVKEKTAAYKSELERYRESRKK